MEFNKENFDKLFATFTCKKDLVLYISKLTGTSFEHRSGVWVDDFILSVIGKFGYTKKDISHKSISANYRNKEISIYLENPNYCSCCGKILPFEKRNNKYCSKHCANKTTNTIRKHSDRTKQKISESVRKYCLFRPKTNLLTKNPNAITYKDAIKQNLILNVYNNIPDNILNKCTTLKTIQKHYSVCECCGKQIKPHIRKNGKLSISKTCSNECRHQLKSNIGKTIQQRLIDEGKHKGWVSRKIISYPERFWIKVLENNHIEYDKEHPFGKYFLDFYIVKNGKEIDLEIDGKQHLYDDRKIKDAERDTYIKENNVIVYRIPWNSINTDEGKCKMKSKIDEFLKFYNNL